MSDEQINIAIAEACGWKQVEGEECFFDNGTEQVYIENIPDYCNDLNAMHEAEMTLILTKRGEYLWHLALICCNCEEGSRTFETTTATAKQRAEAFLKTIGKWEE